MTSDKPTSPPCQLKTEFLYNFCATCGRDEIDMDKCPNRESRRAPNPNTTLKETTKTA